MRARTAHSSRSTGKVPMTSRSRALAACTAAGAVLRSVAASGGSAVADDTTALAAAPDTTAPSLIIELPQPSPRGWYTDAVPVSLVATDVEWSWGTGPEVTGPGEALLLAMLGRKQAVAGLGGDGVATFSSRV